MNLTQVAAQITGQLGDFSELYSIFIPRLLLLILTGFTLQFTWYGAQLIWGRAQFHILDLLGQSFRAMLVVFVGLSGSAYADNVIGIVNDLRNGLVGTIAGADAGITPYEALSQIVGESSAVITDMLPWCWDHFSVIPPVNFTGAIAFFSLLVMGLCSAIYAVISAANFLYIEFALAIAYMLGPLAIAGLAFKPTARFFDPWLAGVFKYVFTAVVIAAVNVMALGIVRTYAQTLAYDAQQGAFLNAMFSAILGFGVIILLAMRAPSVAADLIGGIGLNLISPSAAAPGLSLGARLSGHAVGGAARMTANAAGYAAGAAMRSPTEGEGLRPTGSMSPSQRAIEILQSASRAGSAITNMSPGSIGAAYNAGAGRDAGTGTISGSNTRPVPHAKDVLRPYG